MNPAGTSARAARNGSNHHTKDVARLRCMQDLSKSATSLPAFYFFAKRIIILQADKLNPAATSADIQSLVGYQCQGRSREDAFDAALFPHKINSAYLARVGRMIAFHN
ncbi:MAG: hypothetical protein ABUL58_01550 [Steroidobacter sp.]